MESDPAMGVLGNRFGKVVDLLGKAQALVSDPDSLSDADLVELMETDEIQGVQAKASSVLAARKAAVQARALLDKIAARDAADVPKVRRSAL